MLSAVMVSAAAAESGSVDVLRICADPDNMPYSNSRLEGFDNRIAALIAHELGARVEYSWASLRRGFLRVTLDAGHCDVVMGTPAALPGLALTPPYYKTSYAFVYPSASGHAIEGFDDPVLRESRIGLHSINIAGSNPPPARALSARGLQGNMVGYPLWGRTGESQTQGQVVEAVASGEIDVAVVWGPIGGYFARQHPGVLAIQPLLADTTHPELTFVHALYIGVRDTDSRLLRAINGVLDRKHQEIRTILANHGVPLVAMATAAAADRLTEHTQSSQQ